MTLQAAIRHKLSAVIVIIVQLLSVSLFSLVPTVSVSAAACPSVSGTSAPTGAGSQTFVFNEEQCVWQNSYYTWSPYTKKYTATYDQTPVLNAEGTAWEYPRWDYIASEGKYVKRIVSTPVVVEAEPERVSPPSGTETLATPAQPGVTGAGSQTSGGNTVSSTGPSSSNTATSTGGMDADIHIANDTSVITTLDSVATSGDAAVLQNTNGGSASTGDATAVANYMAMIQSGWNPSAGALSTFNADLFGSFTGDMLFNPDTIFNTGPSSTNSIDRTASNDINVTVSDSASIENNINLTAVSGDATVSQNTNAGSATTGDAKAVANLINMINSSIASQKGFIGNINIHGDFDGDFLLPPALLAQLEHTGPNSSNSIMQYSDTDIDANITRNAAITNNFDLTAVSGDASVNANTNAGAASTGDAMTHVEQQNYIGAHSGGQKGLLVFVNVMGQWVGMMNPSFATIGSTGPNSHNTISSASNTDVDFALNQDYSITNNLNLHAQSGDATVSQNTNAGDAISGDAYAGANVLNLIDSNLSYDDWFGVLFINVFGSWNGSFGTNTSAGGKGAGQPTAPAADAVATDTEVSMLSSAAAGDGGASYVARRVVASRAAGTDKKTAPAVMGSSEDNTTPPTATAAPASLSVSEGAKSFVFNWWILGIGAVLGVGFAIRKQELDLIRGAIQRVSR